MMPSSCLSARTLEGPLIDADAEGADSLGLVVFFAGHLERDGPPWLSIASTMT